MATTALPFRKIHIHPTTTDANANACKYIFLSLQHNMQNSQTIGNPHNRNRNRHSKEDLSWALRNCADSVEELDDILNLDNGEASFETSLSSMGRIGMFAPVPLYFSISFSSSSFIHSFIHSLIHESPGTLIYIIKVPRRIPKRPTSSIQDRLRNGNHHLPHPPHFTNSLSNPPSKAGNKDINIATIVIFSLLATLLLIGLCVVFYRRVILNRRVEKEARERRALSLEETRRAELGGEGSGGGGGEETEGEGRRGV